MVKKFPKMTEDELMFAHEATEQLVHMSYKEALSAEFNLSDVIMDNMILRTEFLSVALSYDELDKLTRNMRSTWHSHCENMREIEDQKVIDEEYVVAEPEGTQRSTPEQQDEVMLTSE